MSGWPAERDELEELQRELAERAAAAAPWRPDEAASIGGVFFASARSGDRAWAAAVRLDPGGETTSAVVRGIARFAYEPGLLALREGALLEGALRSLPRLPDVVLVNASGRDHPRGAGLALHLGSVLGVPTVGVTDRPLLAIANAPRDERFAGAPLRLGDELVGFAVRTRRGARPVLAHSAWRTDADTARAVVAAATGRGRTPEPLRRARFLARVERARDEGRLPARWAHDPFAEGR